VAFGLALAILLAPAAGATAGDARVRAKGLDADGRIAWQGQALAAFERGPAEGWVLRAPHVRIDVYSETQATTLSVQTVVSKTSRHFDATDARVLLSGYGWWGLDRPAWFDGSTQAVEFLPATVMGDDSPADHEDENSTHFGLLVRGPLTAGEAQGSLAGALHVKLFGPTVRVESAQGDQEIQTGSVQQTALVENLTWVVVTAEDATLTLGPAGARVATSNATLAWDGKAWLRGASGHLLAGGHDQTLAGDVALTCRCTGTLAPGADELVLHGDVRATSMRAPLARDSPDPGAPLTMTLILVAGVAVGAWLYRVWQRREVPVDAEECSRLADAAMEAGRAEDAVRWIRRARLLAPASARLAMDEAHAHAARGDHASALRALDQAARLAHDGEPDFQAAALLLARGEEKEAERRMRLALARSPDLARELHADPALRVLAELLRE
jgi:hypothetical protein